MDTRTGDIYEAIGLRAFTGQIESEQEALRAKLVEQNAALGPEDKPYLREMTLAPSPVQRLTRKIQRNDPCPCGSQKKFKRCCLGKPPLTG